MAILFTKWLIVALAFLFAAYLVPGIEVASFYSALILAIAWGLINLIFKPILILLTLPINILTLGFFTIIINGFLLWFLSTVVKGFEVQSFIAAIIGALVISFANWLGNKFISKTRHHNRVHYY